MTVTSTLRLLLTAHVVSRASGIGSPRCGQAAGSTMECCRAGWALRWGWKGRCWLLSRVMKMITTRMVWESAGQRLRPLYCWVRTFFPGTFLGKNFWTCILIILYSCFFFFLLWIFICLIPGVDEVSFAYEGHGIKVSGGTEEKFGEPFAVGDIIGCYAVRATLNHFCLSQ